MQYDPQASSTSKALSDFSDMSVKNNDFRIYYGTGEAHGKLYTDTLRIGDPSGPQLEMTNVPVGVAEKMKYIDHGIIGLSLKVKIFKEKQSLTHFRTPNTQPLFSCKPSRKARWTNQSSPLS